MRGSSTYFLRLFILIVCLNQFETIHLEAKILRFEETNFALELGGAGYYMNSFNPIASILESSAKLTPASSSLIYGLGVSALVHANFSNLIQIRVGAETVLVPSTTFVGSSQSWQTFTHSYNGIGAIDLSMLRRGSLRLYVGILGGYALTIIDVNDKSSSNTLANIWLDQYNWSISSRNWMGDAHLGLDFNAFDYWTLGLEVGYRILNQNNWLAAQSFQISNRSFSAQQELKNIDGTATSISLSAPYASLKLGLYF